MTLHDKGWGGALKFKKNFMTLYDRRGVCKKIEIPLKIEPPLALWAEKYQK